MRGLALGLFAACLISGCSLANDFGDFVFEESDGDDRDGGNGDDGGGAGGTSGAGGGGRGGSGGSGDEDGGTDAGSNEAGMPTSGSGGNGGDSGTDAQVDSGPEPDPICDAAPCDDVASCDSSSGTAECTCLSGYYDFHGDGTECVDLDECQAGLYQCDDDATCFNTQGGYDCTCNPGYVWDESAEDCFDSCLVLLSTTCDPDVGLCIKPTGEAECRCPAGYEDVNGDGTVCAPDAACMALDCDPLALCDSTPGPAACDCPDGFSGDGQSCADIDECTLGTDDCDPNATCTNTLGGFACGCNAGFTGPGTTCDDVDECTADTDGCSSLATCLNSIGDYDCECGDGYSGNGFACSDVNECMLGADDCSADANCTNTTGSFMCACKSGYTGNGVSCSDVDECMLGTDDCDADEGCTNTAGSFTCGCDAGYRKNASDVCVDIDECSENLDNCSANATCTNTTGAFTCMCNGGYSGSGTACTDVDECMLNTDNCSANATCTNNAGSFGCLCSAGYTGNGVTCTDVDECMLNTDNCHPTRAECMNIGGSFACECSDGYTGNGVTCSDINECTTATPEHMDTCDSAPDACVNSVGGYSCMCPGGYSGNGQGGSGCLDINECTLNTDTCDSAPDACVNSVPGYSCMCPVGSSGTGQGQFGCCAPNGANTDVTHPNDGLDNDCDGLWDRPVVQLAAAFPVPGGATSAADLSIPVTASVISGAALQCRSYKRSTAVPPAFGPCANPVRNGASSTSSTNDGAWRTEIRWSFSEGRFSNVVSYDYYVHGSLHGAPRCPALGVTDDQIFTAADAYLRASLMTAAPGRVEPGAFVPTETFLTTPFITIGYRPLTGGSFFLRDVAVGVVSQSSYSAQILSLRRRFTVSSNARYVLMKRTHASRRAYGHTGSIDCKAAWFEVLNTMYDEDALGRVREHRTSYRCDAVVVNRAGAGVCANVASGVITIGPPHNNGYGQGYGYSTSDKFMWMKLLDERGWHGAALNETGFRNFSEKCDTAGCNDGDHELYLPDRSIIRP